LLALAAPVRGWAAPDPARLAARPGFRPKDFTILRDGPWYHAFYIETDDAIPGDTGTRLGHSRSADLYHWDYLDSNFGPGTAAFDNARVWAPHLVKVDGVFYLFYTGVSTVNAQSIGVATSTDLSTWNRLDAPIMDCSIAANSERVPYGQLRDPFVMPDPTTPGRWLTYYGTVFTGGQFMTAGIAATSSALNTAPWTDAGVAWTPEPVWWKNEGQVESPHLFVHDGLWYLLFTSNAGNNPITVLTNSIAPIGAESSWQMRGRLHTVLGYDTSPWFASEAFTDVDGREYFAVVSDDPFQPYPRSIEIRQMNWTPGDWKFSLSQPFGVTSIAWSGSQVVTAGQRADLVFSSVGDFAGRQAHIEVVEKDPGQPDQIIPPGSLGLPESIDMTGSTTIYPWVSEAFPDDDDTPNRLEIQVRIANLPAVSTPTLYVNMPSGGGGGPYRDEARARHAPTEPGTANVAPTPTVTLRSLKETPLGPGFGLLVDLPQSSVARVEILDLTGRRLRTLANGTMPKGATVLMWDGRDDGGRSMPAGIVFARLSTPKETRMVRLAVGARGR
jgi:hypothetical protein